VTAVAASHLYVHVPFCAHRCGYCDFVTVTGNEHLQARYVDALLTEIATVTHPIQTVFIGGGTPTLLADELLARLLAGVPRADEITIECNPETVTSAKAQVLVEGGVTRVSLGAQSFTRELLETLERRAQPETVRRAVGMLREAGVQNLNLDLMFGVPGQDEVSLSHDLDQALSLSPDHISYYELEAKPGTRFTHAHGPALERAAEAMEHYYEVVVATLRAAGYQWYETANFCREGRESQHNLGYWLGHDYLGIGVGAVSTIGLERRRVRPNLPRYLEAIESGRPPAVEVELLTASQRELERLMLGLRLDRPVEIDTVAGVLDQSAVDRMEKAGMVCRGDGMMWLTERGRHVADEVVVSMVR
jgi:oxygen-independent coproporphyrinogen-3 oxidase